MFVFYSHSYKNLRPTGNHFQQGCLYIENKMNRALAEQELLEGCIRGNADCQRLLFQQFYGKMLALCRRYASNEDEAKDFLQEGFIKIFDNLRSYRGESSLQTWMSRVMINNAITQYNKAKHYSFRSLEDEDSAEIADETEAVDEMDQIDLDELLAIIQQLPIGYRTVLNMYAIEGFSHKQIGEMLNIAEGTSKSQLSKARQLLKQELLRTKNNGKHG